MRATVIVTTRFEATHCWKDAPEEVSFLRSPHRHMFHVKASYKVEDPTIVRREVEFFTAKKELDAAIRSLTSVGCGSDPPHLSEMSCENIAVTLHKTMACFCAHVPFSIEVWEDGENGALVEF
jgi:hypothetical protein